MTVPTISNRARIVSLITSIIGTGIFFSYYFTDAFPLLFLGLGFIVLAGIINLIFIISVARQLSKTSNRIQLYFTIGLMLLNIPIMVLYCWMTITLLNTMRITFINETSNSLTDIRIFGCEEKHIDKLEPKESKVVWVGITGDCSVNIEFKKNGKQESENVTGYTTNDMGQRITHKIGWENSPVNY